MSEKPTEQELSDFLDQGGGLASTASSRACPKCKQANAEIERLRRELLSTVSYKQFQDMVEQRNHWKDKAHDCLNDASMADKRDAERYRWLRECSIVRSDRTIYVQKNCYNNGVFRETVYPYGAYLDAEIDAYLAAALSAEKGNDK